MPLEAGAVDGDPVSAGGLSGGGWSGGGSSGGGSSGGGSSGGGFEGGPCRPCPLLSRPPLPPPGWTPSPCRGIGGGAVASAGMDTVAGRRIRRVRLHGVVAEHGQREDRRHRAGSEEQSHVR